MFKIREGYLLRSLVDKWVVVDIGDIARPYQFMLLNDTAARLWNLLECGADEESLAEALTEAYAVDDATALRDARSFVCSLLESGVAEVL